MSRYEQAAVRREHSAWGDAERLLSATLRRPQSETVVCTVVGEIDMLTAPLLADRVHTALSGEPAHLVVDLSGVTFMGAAALHVLDQARDEQEASHRIALVVSRRAVARPLETTNMGSQFPCYPELSAALADIPQPRRGD